ncbi:MAG: hypothetical protein RBU23_00595 [Candidatus Auribacterota bacterium]|jgi:uncharacterized repeat protein (TIGR01451 family)|nr:hypothetical protein [Candidatus Auribacterota bacterium]
MKKIFKISGIFFAVCFASVFLHGCVSCNNNIAPAKAEAKPCIDCGPVTGDNTLAFYYPCDSKACGVLYVEKIAPKQVQVGQEFDYVINVTNVLKYKLTDVKVSEILPSNFTVTSSSPKPSADMTWNLDTLAPNETKQIKITGSAKNEEPMTNCIKISYTPLLCVLTTVIKPSIALTSDSTPEVLSCDKILLTTTVTNNGTGSAMDVLVTTALPSGVETIHGKTSITESIPCLKCGESKTFTYELQASKSGKYTFNATAKAEGNLKAESFATTVVRQPELSIAKTGPEKIYIGRPAKYSITVKNTGDGNAINTVVSDTLPANMSFSSADNNGRLDKNRVLWNLGTLQPNDSKTLNLELVAVSKGSAVNKVSAIGDCCPQVTASATTSVEGIPALLIEVIDLDDPVEVGSGTTYVITVTNQGSADANNVKIVCTLEDSQEYVSCSGATKSEVKGKVISFMPLPKLDPKAQATWNVDVKSVKAGDVRFTVEMNSDELGRPVKETESTNQY